LTNGKDLDSRLSTKFQRTKPTTTHVFYHHVGGHSPSLSSSSLSSTTTEPLPFTTTSLSIDIIHIIIGIPSGFIFIHHTTTGTKVSSFQFYSATTATETSIHNHITQNDRFDSFTTTTMVIVVVHLSPCLEMHGNTIVVDVVRVVFDHQNGVVIAESWYRISIGISIARIGCSHRLARIFPIGGTI
jgi:hypothetical protein